MVTYREAGVDIDRHDALLRWLGPLVKSTYGAQVAAGHGAFSGAFLLGDVVPGGEVLLVATADGVGTKVLVAKAAHKLDGLGHDIVAHSINDLLASGAEPLFMMDYFAAASLDVGEAKQVLGSLVDACKRWGVVLLGGETAEMPGVYREGTLDLVGFMVGTVSRDRLLTRERVRPDSALVMLPSSGLHTNGYSLARRVLLEKARLRLDDVIPELGRSLAEELLEPHRCYLEQVRPLLREGLVDGIAHITGGGIPGNLARVLPEGVGAVVDAGTWEIPSVFRLIQRLGEVPSGDMWRTFNMGVGMILVVRRERVDEVLEVLSGAGAFVGGRTEEGEGVRIVGVEGSDGF